MTLEDYIEKFRNESRDVETTRETFALVERGVSIRHRCEACDIEWVSGIEAGSSSGF